MSSGPWKRLRVRPLLGHFPQPGLLLKGKAEAAFQTPGDHLLDAHVWVPIKLQDPAKVRPSAKGSGSRMITWW